MGGKNKPAQRIKNNARPSSSGRSAELLASSSNSQQIFSQYRETRFLPPTLSLLKTEEFDASVSPTFQLVFKKMNKKDCITKIKGLQEFSDLIAESDSEAVKAVLGFWAQLYSILATDPDHKVREALHNAHYQIILKEKRIIAPYLKQLIGPWFTALYDNYPPAATAASKAFSATFPANKIQDCVVFCQKEILTYIENNLQSDVNSKQCTNEEAEAKYERIIVSTLQGYCLYLDTLTEEQISKCIDLNRQIITTTRFLNLATHQTILIRATFFKTLAVLYNKAPFLLEENQAQIVPLIFNNLDENEPSVVGFVWEAALLIMNSNQEWWKLINIEKKFVAKLKKVLREAGQGSAAVIYPNLLSILHKLPESIRLDQFYDGFFENLRLGLKRKSVISSKSESTAIITATIECLQYVILINECNTDLCEKLIKTHLLPLIETSLSVDQIAYKIVFQKTAALIQYWTRNKNLKNYGHYADLFWGSLPQMLKSHSIFDRHVIFIQFLKTVKPKERLKVKFSSTETEENKSKRIETIDDSYNIKLLELVYDLLKFYVLEIEEKKIQELLQHVVALVKMFESLEFLKHLKENADLMIIYQDLLKKWMKDEALSSEIVVDLIFIVLKYLNDEAKEEILLSFFEFSDLSLSWCVQNALSYPFNSDQSIRKWLKHSKISDFLLLITESNLKCDCLPEWKILFKLAFTSDDNDELMIDKLTISKIISKLQIVLKSARDFENVDFCLHLASHVAQTIYTEQNLLKYDDALLLSLFEFSCGDYSDFEYLTSDTNWEVSTTWQDIVTILAQHLSKIDFIELVRRLADIVEENFLLKDAKTEQIIQTIQNLIRAIFQSQPLMVTDIYTVIFGKDFWSQWKEIIEGLCIKSDYLIGRYSAVEEILSESGKALEEGKILKYFIWCYIKITVLMSSLKEQNDDEEDEDIKDVIFVVDDREDVIVDLLHDLAIVDTFLGNYTMSKHFSEILAHQNLIKEKLQQLLTNYENISLIKEKLADCLNSGNWLWAKTVKTFHQDINSDGPQATYHNYSKLVKQQSARINLIQIYGSSLSFDDIHVNKSIYEYIIILKNLSHCPEIDVQIAEVLGMIKHHRAQNIQGFLLETTDSNWEALQIIIEIIQLFTTMAKTESYPAYRQHWDLPVISLSTWSTNCLKLRTHYAKPQIQCLFVAIINLFVALSQKITLLKQEEKMTYVEEWEDLLLPNIQTDLLDLWYFIVNQFNDDKMVELKDYTFLQEIGNVIDCFSHKLICSREGSRISWIKIVNKCTQLLVNPLSILQLWGFKFLQILVLGLIELDLQTDLSNVPNSKGLTLTEFKEVLSLTHTIVDNLLSGFKLGEDSCQVTAFTDSYTYVFGYLSTWNVLLSLCEKAPPELRYQYADWLRTENYFKTLLNNLFKLMPAEILHYNEGKAKVYLKLFTHKPNMNLSPTSENLEHLACWIYFLCLSQLPALVRQWWFEADTKVTQIVERVTSFYVSPQLCSQELHNVSTQENTFKNMVVRTVPLVREVIAVYTVDEAQMELIITLPLNYPLGGPDVRCSKQIGGPMHKQWLMQLKKYLLHQNGRIWDGLFLWNSSLDKKFDGVEECYICFAILHPGTYQLPKLTCQTCKKKFHSACLYKWFSTSNKSSCPICRNLF